LLPRRKDLQLIITSATIDTHAFSEAFGNAPIIEVSGRLFPVEIRYAPLEHFTEEHEDDIGFIEASARAVEDALIESNDGDVLVFFRSSDVIAAGDIYSTVGYPRIDVARGGHVNGVIEGLNRLIDLAISEQFTEGGTRIVPGRGRVSDEFDVVEYRDMVTIVRDRVQALVAKGQTLEQVKAARPTLDWEPRYGSTSGPWTTAQFVEAVYRSLAIQGGK
jgi:hypothetical protein